MTLTCPFNLGRFTDAQKGMFELALTELRAGSKRSHWMWFIFPQLAALGRSHAAKFYGIGSLGEARAYIEHPLLGTRLRLCTEAMQEWAGVRSAEEILGSIDAMKLRSSVTLFERVEPDSVFTQVLLNFFGGNRDELTLALLEGRQ